MARPSSTSGVRMTSCSQPLTEMPPLSKANSDRKRTWSRSLITISSETPALISALTAKPARSSVVSGVVEPTRASW